MNLSAFWKQRVAGPLVDLLSQGMAAEAIALSVALGLVLGVFPIFGFPTLFCTLAAAALRLNLPAIQCVNYLAYPLQFALLIPFIRLGDWLFRAAPSIGGAGEIGRASCRERV